MTPELKSAIEDVYAAFSDVPRPQQIGFCSHCRTEEMVAPLIAKPLREITPDELRRYAFSALNTMGDVPDFLYLLPCILECLTGENLWVDVEVVLPKLKEAGFFEWPNHRCRAVLHYFDAVLAVVLEKNDCGWELDEWICGFARLLDDVAPYLKRIEGHPAAVLSYYEQNSESLIKGRLCNAFWDHESAGYHQVLDWFNSPEMRKMTTELYGL